MIDFDDWLEIHARQAASEGWCLCQTGNLGYAPLEIRAVVRSANHCGQAHIPSVDLDDAVAVNAFREAWQRGDSHADLAYVMLASHSPMEFTHWNMISWKR